MAATVGKLLPQWTKFNGGVVNLQFVRFQSKHFNPKYRKYRAAKVIKVKLPDYQKENEEGFSDEKANSWLKKMGMQPARPWMERGFYIASTGAIQEPYVPPEGDGKLSAVSVAGAKQKLQFVEKKSKSMMAIRKIGQYEEDFKSKTFAQHAHDIYVQAHTYLAEKNFSKLEEFVTERCYPEMIHNVRYKTLRWSFLGSLEPPRVVQARCMEMITRENQFAQVTVRFHTQQKLAIYDRFGRLMYGSEILAKDVLEYVVFEKHLANVYGTWRLHGKIIPDWAPVREPSFRTFIKPEPEQEKTQDQALSKAVVEDNDGGDFKVATA